MAQRYYQTGEPNATGTRFAWMSTDGKKSTALPGGTDNTVNADMVYGAISTSNASPATNYLGGYSFNTLAQTAAQGRCAAICAVRVGAGTFGSGAWSCTVASFEGNGAANAFFAVSVYLYREGTGVVSYVYDASTSLGTEFTSTPRTHRVGSFTGANVTSLNGDYLCWEIWAVGTQSMATTYLAAAFAGNPISATADTTDGSESGRDWLEAPAAFPAYSAATPIGIPFLPGFHRPQFTRPRRRIMS